MAGRQLTDAWGDRWDARQEGAQWDRSATSGIDAKADTDGYVNPPERPGVDD